MKTWIGGEFLVIEPLLCCCRYIASLTRLQSSENVCFYIYIYIYIQREREINGESGIIVYGGRLNQTLIYGCLIIVCKGSFHKISQNKLIYWLWKEKKGTIAIKVKHVQNAKISPKKVKIQRNDLKFFYNQINQI